MSTPYTNLTPYQLRWVDEKIHNTVWQKTKFLNFFTKSPGAQQTRNAATGSLKIDGGLVKSVEEGLEEVVTTNYAKMKPGQISGGVQDIPKQYIKLEQSSAPLMYLTTKVVIGRTFADAWANNNFIKAGQMLDSAISQAMLPLINQVDQFLAYGDDMKDPISSDSMSGAGKFTGLFNGFQTFAGGDGEDNDVADAGDFISTYVNGRDELKEQGYDGLPYYILSDHKTASAAEKGNNLYKTYAPVTEKRALIREYGTIQNELAGWLDSINAIPNSGSTKYRMAITQPFISQRGKKIEPAYMLYQGYNFRVFPIYGGGLNSNLEYEYAIIWSGRLQEIGNGSYALYHTGDLTLT